MMTVSHRPERLPSKCFQRQEKVNNANSVFMFLIIFFGIVVHHIFFVQENPFRILPLTNFLQIVVVDNDFVANFACCCSRVNFFCNLSFSIVFLQTGGQGCPYGPGSQPGRYTFRNLMVDKV